MNDPFNRLDHVLQPAPGRSGVSLNNILALVAALLSVIAAALGALPYLSGWTTKHPSALKISIGLAVVILAWIVHTPLIASVRRRQKRSSELRFIKEQSVKLRELIRRLHPFITSDDTRGFIRILRSSGPEHMPSVSPIINSPDYIPGWVACFQKQLISPAATLNTFLAEYGEFLTILNNFNRDYVLRTQRSLSTVQPLSEASIADLEQFREEFAAYLRDVEQWADKIFDEAKIRTGDPQHWILAPKTCFERAKSFRRAAASTQPQ